MSNFFSRKKAPLNGAVMGEGKPIDLTKLQIKNHFESDLLSATGKTGGYISMMQLTQTLDKSEKVLLESRSAEPKDIGTIKESVQNAFLMKNSEKIIGTVPKLKKAMALSLIEELRSVTGKEYDDLLKIVQEKLALVHKNFSDVIRSMSLEASLDTPEKAEKFILMTHKDFPESYTLIGINISNNHCLFKVFDALRGSEPALSSRPFADAAIAGAGAGSGSSTDASRTPSPI